MNVSLITGEVTVDPLQTHPRHRTLRHLIPISGATKTQQCTKQQLNAQAAPLGHIDAVTECHHNCPDTSQSATLSLLMYAVHLIILV